MLELNIALWFLACDILAVLALDIQGEVSFTKNGRQLGVAYRLPQGTTGPFFPALVLKNAQVSGRF